LELGGNGISNKWIFEIEKILDRNSGKLKENLGERPILATKD